MVAGTASPARLFSGIRTRLLGMVLVALLPLIVALCVGLYQNRKNAIETAGWQVQEIARRAATRYREVMVEAHTLLRVAAAVPEVTRGSPENCRAFLARAGAERPWIEGLAVIDETGHAICATTPGAIGVDISDRAYFRKAMAQKSFVVSDFIVNRVTNVPVSVAALPLVGDDGTVHRVLMVMLRLSWFTRLIDDIAPNSDLVFSLTDVEGVLMARWPERPERIGRVNDGNALVRTMLSRSEGWTESTSLDGVARISGFVEIEGSGAHIAVGIDRSKVLERVDAQITRGVTVIATAIALAVLIGLAVASRIAKPLTALTAGAEAARRSPDVELPAVHGYAEVESLSRSLNALLADLKRREEALSIASAETQAANALLREAIEAVPVGFAFFDAEDRYVLWNRLYADIYEGNPFPLQPGVSFSKRLRSRLDAGLIPGAVGHEDEWLAERMANFRAASSSHEQRLGNGRWLRCEERRTSQGGSIGIRIDITESKRREESFRLLFDANPVPMWVFDRQTLQFLAVNDAAVEHYGYGREQFLTMTVLDIRDAVDHDEVREAVRSDEPAFGDRVWRHRRADGSERLVCAYTRLLVYEQRPAKLAALIDITDKWHDEARIRHLAHYDSLTELANRTLFRARLQQALAHAHAPGEGVALICIDLDGFKDVNDSLGHPVGDELLKLVAQRLRHCVQEPDTAARLGGDEFAVIKERIADRDEAGELATMLIGAISAPYLIEGHEITVTPSVGIATTLDGPQSLDQLLSHADIALYRAKARGRRSWCFFAPEMDAELKARRALETRLRAAFERRQLEVHYQPWVDLADTSISGFEALLRWPDPERGMISPAEFIPLAEANGLIVPLGEWVLDQACADAARWPEPIKLAVNLSPIQFRTGDIVAAVRAALRTSGLAPHRVELEITETVLLEDNASNLATLHALRSLGVRIAMDDFGTGYSSLGYLRRFPFDKIKIDRSFVSELPHNADCLTITRGVTELASGLGMSTIAEGIETAGQREILRAIGCTHGQGFLFGRAMPAPEVAKLLSRNRGIAAA